MDEQRLKSFAGSLGGSVQLRLQQIEALAKKDKAALAALLAREAELASDEAEKEWLLFKSGDLFVELNRKDQALAQFAKIKNRREWKILSLLVLEENARYEGDFSRLAQLYGERAKISEPEERKALTILRSRILAFAGGDRKEAEKILDQLAKDDSLSLPLVLTRAQLYLEEGDWKKLAESYKSLFELGEKAGEKVLSASCACRIAGLMEGRNSSPLAALEWYGKLFDGPEAVYALGPAIEILESLRQVKELKAALQKFEALVPAEERWLKALVLFKQSQICELEGDKEGEAELLTKAVALDPENLLAFFRLESIARAGRDYRLLAACLEGICKILSESELKFFYLVELAHIYLDFLEEPAKCEQIIAQAKKIKPDALEVLRLRQSLAFQNRDFAALSSALSDEIKLCQDPKELQTLLIRKAEASFYGGQDLKQAAENYRQALEIAASQFPLLRSLEQILLQSRDFEGWVKIMLAIEKLVSPIENRIYYAWRRALVSELGLGKAELAVAALSDVIRLKPDLLPVLFALARILRYKRAGENYIKAAERTVAAGQALTEYAYLLYQAGWDFETLFNQAEKAQELGQKFYQTKSPFPVLLYEQRRLCYRSRDWARLEEIWLTLAGKIKNPGLVSSFLLRAGFLEETFLGEPGKARANYEKAIHQAPTPLIYPALIELACFQSDWQSASALLKDFARKLAQPLQAAFIWQSAMLLWEKSKSPAEQILAEIKLAEETGAGPLEKVTKVEFLRRQSNYQALAQTLEEMISLLDETRLLPPQIEHAWILTRRTNQNDQAIEQYLKILSANDKYLPAVRELEFFALEMNHPRLMAQALARELSTRKEPEVVPLLYHWLALVYEEDLKDNEQAISVLRGLLKLRPDWLPGLSELRRLYGKAKAYSELVKTITAQIPLTQDPNQKLALLKEQADIYEKNLGSPETAVNAYLSAHSLNPKNPEILANLSRLYLHLQKWPELVEITEKETALEQDAQKRAELQIQAARLYEEKLNDSEKAVQCYERAENALSDYMPLLRALERLYPRLNRSKELVRVLEKIAGLVSDRNEKADVLNRIGKIYREKLNDLESAVKTQLRVLEVAPENQPALESLVALYREKSDLPNLVKSQERLAGLLSKAKPELAQSLFLEAGATCEKNLQDENCAINYYRRAWALAPNDLRPVRAERAIFERRQEWKEVVRLLDQEARIVSSGEEKKELAVRIGNLYEEKLKDLESAAKYYQAGLKLDAEYLPALKPLAEIYYRGQAWLAAEPLYQTWIKSLSGEKPERQAEILYQFGVVEEKLNQADRAIECYQNAAKQKPGYLDPLSRLFELFLNKGDKQKAVNSGQELASALEQAGDHKQIFSVLSRLGALEKEQGQDEKAIEYLERATALEQNHYPSLRLLVDLYNSKKDWPKSLSTYDRLVRSAGTPDLICQGLLEKGEILDRELNQRESAIAHFKKAVQVKPESLTGWRLLAAGLKAEKKWNEAAESYHKIIELEPNPKNKVDDIYSLGMIYRDGFVDLSRARECFEQVLNLNKTHIPSMEAILSIYLKQKQWQKYIELSQRFIGLIPKQEEKRAAPLHYQRAQVYRDFIEDRQKAIIEFQNATRLDPDNVPARIEVAELYAKDTNSYPLAIREHQEVISRSVFRLESYHQMGQIYELMGKLDEAFCCYKVLDLFKTANRDETMFLEANEPQVTRSSGKTIADDVQYRLLAHPDCRGALLEIIAEVGDYFAELLPPQLEKTGASRSNKVQPTSTAAVKKLADEIALNLGIPAYDLYLVPNINEPRIAATEPPSLILNPGWVEHLRPEERRFILGKYMAHLKFRHALVFNNPIAEVFRSVMLFVWLVVPEVKVPGVPEADLERMAKPIKRAVPRKVRAALEEKAKILAREGLPKNVAAWQRGVMLTGNFAGTLLSNDLVESLSAALKFDNRYKNVNLRQLQDPKPALEQSEDAREMIRFWASEAFFTLRKRSGFSLLST